MTSKLVTPNTPSASVSASPSPSKPTTTRRSANYAPGICDDNFVQSLKSVYKDKTYAIHVEKLKNYAKQLLEEETNHAAQIELIETNQWLGVGYLFDKEIKSALNYIKNKSDNSTNEVEDLHSVSLRFRLMRQHGYMVPQARVKRVTKKFGGDEKLPMAKLLLIADENCGGFPKKVESDSVRPSPNAKQNSGMRTPNLVARLMGLQSMPSGHRDKPKKSSAPGFAYYQEKEPSKTSEFYSYDS